MIKFNLNYMLYLLLLFSFFISRIIFLDSDLPPWKISEYQSIDELYYTLGSFNIFNHFTYNHVTFDFLLEPKYVTNWLEEIITYISLMLFGNNYYGLRMSSVFSGLAIVLMVNYILYYYKNNFLNKDINIKYTLVFVSLYMLIDFSFTLSNRVAEPTIYRILAIMILFVFILIISKNTLNKRKSFLIGFLSFSAFIYVYTTNLFILPAIGLSILFFSYRRGFRISICNILTYLFGILISFFLFLIVYKYIVGGNYIENFLYTFSLVSNRVNENFYSNIINLLSTNIFRFNTSFLFLTMFCLPWFIYIVFIKRNTVNIILFNLILMFLIQTLFVNDYFHRKLILLFPLLMMMISIVYLHKDFLLEKINCCIYIKGAVVLYLFIIFYISYKMIDNSLVEINFLNKFILIITLIFILSYLLELKIKLYKIVLFFFMFSSTNIFMNCKYIYSNPTYKYKNVMINLSNDINNEYVAGWSHAIRLYNNCRPLMSKYVYSYLDKNIEKEHKQNLIDNYGLKYEIGLLKTGSENIDGFTLIKILDINEVAGRKLGLFKLNDK